MSVLLLFMGFDLISHSIQDLIQSWAGEEEHGHTHHHNHQRVSPGSVDVSALFAIASTLVSALLLKNHVRIGKGISILLLAVREHELIFLFYSNENWLHIVTTISPQQPFSLPNFILFDPSSTLASIVCSDVCMARPHTFNNHRHIHGFAWCSTCQVVRKHATHEVWRWWC